MDLLKWSYNVFSHLLLYNNWIVTNNCVHGLGTYSEVLTIVYIVIYFLTLFAFQFLSVACNMH